MNSSIGAEAREAAADRLASLRAAIEERGVDGFIVPHADEHHHEWLPPRAQRLAWLTGFSGSAGVAIVLRDQAVMFVDGRYTLQVRREIEEGLYTVSHLIEQPPRKWIAKNLPAGTRLGFDPWLHTQADAKTLRQACEGRGAELVAIADNPLDAIWTDQPEPPCGLVIAHAERYAGRPAEAKRQEVAKALKDAGVVAAVITLPESIAWLLNIRGADVADTPLPLSFAIMHADAGVELFIDPRKLTPELEAHLGNHISIAPPEALASALDRLGTQGARVQISPQTASAWLFDRLAAAGAAIHEAPDPCILPKARKNDTEIAGAIAAHRRDGAALARFFHWLSMSAPSGKVTEISAEEQLAAFRATGEHFRGLSFSTISGAGPNGAIVHYRASPQTERRLEPGSLYLVDSGAQYLDGTTDVTRTVAIGEPTAEIRDRFTRVLKGHIGLATARFPVGTTGAQLDVLARQHLWQAGLDYDHGTGHGVGSYLGVHEGPQRIARSGAAPLEVGMIISNEPGYYKEGAYGIRIENLVVVVPCPLDGAECEMLTFETLTLAPIDLTLVDTDLLDDAERSWLNDYHDRVRSEIGLQVDSDTAAWLAEATRPVS